MRDPRSRPWLVALVALSLIALVIRLYAARTVGFGDSEALYASYALFPSPAHLDHPGLIGILARWLGHGFAPVPATAHVFTSIAATLAPWAVVLACRAIRATMRASVAAAIAVAVAPEIAVGLFGMTPDLPLFFAWIATLALFGRALLSKPGSTTAAALFLASGVTLGVACASKVSALTLLVALVVTLSTPLARAHARTLWPWAALTLAALVFAPVVFFEARTGWPMLRHRLITTQEDAGLSVRNALAGVFGQAAYVSPVLFVCGLFVARDLFRSRRVDVIRSLLAATTFIPLIILGVLCLWSRVAEPHWLAPAWLPLPLYFAVRSSGPAIDIESTGGPLSARTLRLAIRVGLASSALVYAWVLIPSLSGLVPRRGYDARLDIANELFGWPEAISEVRHAVEAERVPLSEPGDVVVVGPSWMVCAQLRAALPASIPVGCAGDNVADFVTWNPKRAWSRAETVIFVHDNRAPADSATLFPDRTVVETHNRTVIRGGHVARVFTIEVLAKRAVG